MVGPKRKASIVICPKCGKENWKGFGDTPWNVGDGLVCANCNFTVPQYVPSPDKAIWHAKDIEWFTEYPAPVYANAQRLHFTNVNSTIPYFGPMLYFLVRQLGCEQILEIGHAEGFSSFYLAHGVKDNATRFAMAGNHYYGIDIVQTESTRAKLEREGLPVTVINKDSMTLGPDSFPGVVFDLIFQDGAHDAEHVMYEFKAMWPQLKGEGNGFWIAHDCYGPAEEGCRDLLKYIKNNNINVEFLRIPGQYGLFLIRKMDGLDPEKRFWA